MPTREKSGQQGRTERRRHQSIAEDERGWAGQHGQRPANEDEQNYRPSEHRHSGFVKHR